ncbi:MAG: hypothetical protein WC812_01685 [Candidatus Pacearchaeota archaeon]|jgi:hypothetical protein
MIRDNFPLERILNVSATEYCLNAGKELKDYDLIGVHVDDDLPCGARLISRFQERVPSNAEVVVSFSYAIAGGASGTSGVLGLSQTHRAFLNQYASGTALIPREK